jgi:chorismate--pyruvate lyase
LSSFFPHIAVLEPAWVTLGRRRPGSVSAATFGWLRDRGSLTARLIAACGGDFRVRLCHQGWGKPLPSERRLLGMGRARHALVREVELHCNDRPWVFARTVIPAGSLRGAARGLALLGERPLGAVLFADPRTRRGRSQMARLVPHQPLFEAAAARLETRPAELWGRRTVFFFAGQPLLVNEIFLPGIPDA